MNMLINEPGTLDKLLPYLDKAGKAVEEAFKGGSEIMKFGFTEYMKYLVAKNVVYLILEILSILFLIFMARAIVKWKDDEDFNPAVFVLGIASLVSAAISVCNMPKTVGTIVSPVGATVSEVLDKVNPHP